MSVLGPDDLLGISAILGGPEVAVEIAWGADLTADESTWTWTVHTADVRVQPGLSWRLGRSDESSDSNPAELSLVLTNTTGDYSLSGRSAHYPYVRQGTPVRLLIDPSDSTPVRVAFIGSAVSWTPGWDTLTGKIPVVTLTASGTLRRLAQGTDPVQSPMRRYLLAEPDVVAYWSCEQGSASSFIPADVGGQSLTWSGTASLSTCSAFVASLPIPTTNGVAGVGAAFLGKVDAYAGPADQSQGVRFLASLPTSGIADASWLVRVKTTGSVAALVILYRTGGNLEVRTYNALGVQTSTSGSAAFGLDGLQTLLSLEMFQTGGVVHYGLNSLQPGRSTYQSISGDPHVTATIGRITSVEIDPGATVTGLGFGHVAVLKARSATDPLNDVYQQLNGTAGENITGVGRLQRLCNENGVSLTFYSGPTDATTTVDRAGTQGVKALLALLRDCETQERGQLWDGLTTGLAYTTRRAIENAVPTLTIDAAAGQLAPPFAPTNDDQRTRNRVSANRTGGATFVAEDATGPAGTSVIGIYPDTVEVNSLGDAAALDVANWLVHAGTIIGYRYPTLTVDLRANPELAGQVLDLYPGARADLTGLDSVLDSVDADDVSVLVEGISHTLNSSGWVATLACSPFEVWRIAEMAAETGDTGTELARLGTDGTTLNTARIPGQTALSVLTSHVARWSLAADDYPMYLDVGGHKVRATACTGTGFTQTMTVDVLTVSIPVGVSIDVWREPALGL